MIRISSYKKRVLKKKFRKLLLQKECERVVSDSKIKTIGIISTDEISNWIDIKEKVETAFNSTHTKIYSFRPHSRKNERSYKHFSEKDYNLRGRINQPNFKLFLDEPFDLLIGFFNKKNIFLEMAVLQSNAKFKVGIAKVNQDLYDIEIAEYPKNIDNFLLELKKYLQILKKIKN